MKSIINVALNLPLYGTYSYLIPEGIDNIKIGVRVEVPFGRKKLIGICVGVDKDSKLEKHTYKLKYLNNYQFSEREMFELWGSGISVMYLAVTWQKRQRRHSRLHRNSVSHVEGTPPKSQVRYVGGALPKRQLP